MPELTDTQVEAFAQARLSAKNGWVSLVTAYSDGSTGDMTWDDNVFDRIEARDEFNHLVQNFRPEGCTLVAARLYMPTYNARGYRSDCTFGELASNNDGVGLSAPKEV